MMNQYEVCQVYEGRMGVHDFVVYFQMVRNKK